MLQYLFLGCKSLDDKDVLFQELEFLSLVAHYKDADMEERTFSMARALVLKVSLHFGFARLF